MIQSTLSMSHQEWLEDRRKGIGGSDVATILGLNQYKSAYQLWLEKTGQVELKDTEKRASLLGKCFRRSCCERVPRKNRKKFVVEIKSSNIRSILF